MLGIKLFKGQFTDEQYAECAIACNEAGNLTIEDKGEYYEVVEIPGSTLEELKEAKHNAAGAAFAAKRDAIRFVKLSDGNTYGFDCANEDITNFMANWKAAELDGQTEHKVWLDETTKGMVVMQPADFKTVFDIANKSQKEAYVWYGEVATRIAAATSKEELDAIEL